LYWFIGKYSRLRIYVITLFVPYYVSSGKMRRARQPHLPPDGLRGRRETKSFNSFNSVGSFQPPRIRNHIVASEYAEVQQ
jgi:hypothetical protein